VATYHVFDALGDSNRRLILDRLRHGPTSVGALAAGLPITRPAVSQHLRVLEGGGLVSHESVGTRNIYRLDPAGLAALREWLDEFWGSALEAFARHVESSPSEVVATGFTDAAATEPADDRPERRER
jgi:DNA-binding transcriptional ArsR family regulator